MKPNPLVFICLLILLSLPNIPAKADPLGLANTPLNSDPPAQPTRLIFIHHSTGENLLADDNGGLGIALMNNRYFVSDTNYGWGPDSIGDRTDIGHWWLWFRGPDSTNYLNALYLESNQYASYSRLPTAPAGANQIILFKSCFPNSALQGDSAAAPPPIANNPLKAQDSSSPDHTVANAKGIYISLLDYFQTRQDTLFVVLTAPPLSDPAYAANARVFNQWLTTEWLKNYPYRNVVVFDFYNTLTTNGGSPDINDLNRPTGNHHRLYEGIVQHKTDGDNDADPDTLEYPSGDDHPSQAGNLKAVAEFVPLLNVFYHCWQGTGGCPAGSIQAHLESPQQNSFESGIGLIRGWICQANTVEVQIDDGARRKIAYGTTRGDTLQACGDTDNGFGYTFNWNALGTGNHRLRAFADGVEFANVTFNVTTLGADYLQGVSGEYTLPDFPETGRTVTVRWAEPHQNFVIVGARQNPTGNPAAAAVSRAGLLANLESPYQGSFESGVGLIRGWVCQANTVEVQIDDGARRKVAYGTTRGDTLQACGDTDNGFGYTFNWNALDTGNHQLRAFADDVEFANVAFNVTTLGADYLQGVSGEYPLPNFPQVGQSATIRWAEPHQNFVIVNYRQ
jgi:hypothetical protein